jgi:hypothetical protein
LSRGPSPITPARVVSAARRRLKAVEQERGEYAAGYRDALKAILQCVDQQTLAPLNHPKTNQNQENHQ